EAGDERGVVGARVVAVQLDPVVEEPLDVVERVGPVVVAGELDLLPDLLAGRLGADLLQLPLHLADLAVDATAEELDVLQPRAQPELRLTRHGRRGAGGAPGRPAGPCAGRSRPDGRSGCSTRRGRSRPAASRGSPTGRRGGR